jgi:predicted phage terminase large subunit-like protein
MNRGGWRPGAGRKPNNPARTLPALPGMGDTYTPPAPTAQEVAALITPDPNRGGNRPKAGRPRGRKDVTTIIREQAAVEAAKIMQATQTPGAGQSPTWTMEAMLAAFAQSTALNPEARTAAAKSLLARRPEEMLQVLRKFADDPNQDVVLRTRCATYILDYAARQPVAESFPVPEDVAQRIADWALAHGMTAPITPEDYRLVYLAMGPLVFAQVLDIRVAGNRRFEAAPHLVLISDLMQRAATEPCRFMVSVPPRHGKSELISFIGPIWKLAVNPSRRIIMTGYESDFASSWGRRVRNAITERPWLGVLITSDSSAAGRWDTTAGGAMLSTGLGGAITGKGADDLIVDDYCKNRADADSDEKRKNLWDWWTSTAYTRLEPGGSVMIVATRWHEDDLIGRIEQQKEKTGETWEYIRLPALAEENDPLGRKPGEALWPERFAAAELERIKLIIGPRDWSALYQQRPAAQTGNMFKRADLRFWSQVGHRIIRCGDQQIDTAKLRRFMTSDLALAAKAESDYTVHCHWGWHPGTKFLLLLDLVRGQWTGPDSMEELRLAYRRWQPNWVGVEDKHYGLLVVQQLRREGLPIKTLVADRDKVSRAQMAAVLAASGLLWLPEGHALLPEVEFELLGFPRTAHDDIVDNVAYAAMASQTELVAGDGIVFNL